MPFLTSIEGTNAFGKGPPATGSTPAPPTSLRLNIIGDSSTATVVSALNTARTAAGYTTTITYTQTLIAAGYTGADLTTANYDVILVYMNGGLSVNASLGANINAYINSGGKAVFGVFLWNIAISGFCSSIADPTNTPFKWRGAQSNEVATMTVTVVSPITTGVTTTLSNGQSTFNHPNLVAQPTATIIATAPSGNPLVATQISPRRVGINMFPVSMGSYANEAKLFLNAILWCGGILN
jgi:hypothetical protein